MVPARVGAAQAVPGIPEAAGAGSRGQGRGQLGMHGTQGGAHRRRPARKPEGAGKRCGRGQVGEAPSLCGRLGVGEAPERARAVS